MIYIREKCTFIDVITGTEEKLQNFKQLSSMTPNKYANAYAPNAYGAA